MIVVPPLAHRENCEKPIVAAIVVRLITLVSKHVAQRIDRERPVPQKHGAQEKPNEQHGPTTDPIRGKRQNRRGHEPISIQPHELGVFRQILDATVVRLLVFRDEQPANVRIPKPAPGIMGIAVLIRQTMVHAMMRAPPQRSFLGARLGQKCQNKLKNPTRLVRAMGKIAMITAGHSKHPHPIKRRTDGPILPSSSRPKCKQWHQMHHDERNSSELMIIPQWFFRFRGRCVSVYICRLTGRGCRLHVLGCGTRPTL